MSRWWWRAYDEAVDDPKLQCLSNELFRFWFNLCCVCSAFGGNLPSEKHLAFKTRMQERKVVRLLGELRSAGLIDEDNQGIRPHNWEKRQFKSDLSTERVKRFRNVSGNVSETPPENRVQNTETEKKETRARGGALAAPWSETNWIEFWATYPNRVGKADARKAFERATKKVSPGILFPALQRYATKTDDRPFCNPATWLNQERWLDEPAKSNGRRTIQQAADDLLAKIRAFDEPAPSGICDGAGEAS